MAMISCGDLDELATPYLDGEAMPVARQAVDEHLAVCPPCRDRLAAEGTARTIVHERRPALCAVTAPPGLRARCAGAAARSAPRPGLRRLFVPMSAAATLLLVVGGLIVYAANSRSATVLAAQLTLDHMKCFALQPSDAPPVDTASIDRAFDARFGWNVDVPQGGGAAPIQLVGARRCFYADGAVAHLLYRHDGHDVSLFLLPHTARPEGLVHVMGHETMIWPERDWTCVLVGQEPPAEMQRIAAYVRDSLHGH
ncbi:MAG: zf-HC2 domain-containing protein [Acidobacteriota bacterium]|nr:zf-HC2 domain-containing protein [Acidobacteriota bacterium]